MLIVERLFAALAALVASAVPAPQAEPIAIVGVDVLPMTRSERLSDQTVIVRGDRIVRIGPRRSVPVPAGTRQIRGRGLTLMPGLVDMHIHLAPVPGAQGDAAHRALAVMLAHGVTTARAMVGSPNNLVVREAIERGALAGPRLYVAAPGLTPQNTPTPEAARAATDAARAAGYDFMKIFSLPELSTWQALQDSAREARLPVAGHVSNTIGTERAAAAGQQIEHLDGTLHALLPGDSPARNVEFGQFPPQEVIEALDGVSEARLTAFARRMAEKRSWHVPTLSLFERFVDMDTPLETLRALPELRYLPDSVTEQWANQRTEFRKESGFTATQAAAFARIRRRIAGAFHRAGVRMMPGSDSAQQFQVWGVGLLREIDALHGAGVSRIEALRSATVLPRDYFRSLSNGGSSKGRVADFGTVEPGARADLILLRGDPSRDLSALRQLQAVIAAGRLYDRAALDRMLESAAAAAKRPS